MSTPLLPLLDAYHTARVAVKIATLTLEKIPPVDSGAIAWHEWKYKVKASLKLLQEAQEKFNRVTEVFDKPDGTR